jgi:threonine dehydrogenase-like Zn-dependent dehydrogenase
MVIAAETVPDRKELSTHYGEDVVVDFVERDSVQVILELTDGQGVDAAIEALGAQETFAACVKATRPRGTISNVGYHGAGDFIGIPRAEWGVGMSDKTIRTALCPGGATRMRRLMRLIQTGRVDPLPMTAPRASREGLPRKTAR